jgi:3-oxoadipate enol-lactonase
MVRAVDSGPVDRIVGGRAWRERGSGPVVLLLHGLGGSSTSWEPQFAGLADAHRVVAWDLPGYGASAPLEGDVTFTGLAAAVAELVGVLGVDAVHLVGLSFGGMIAQRVALDHPQVVTSLTLASTSPCFGLDGTRPDDWVAARLAPLQAGLQPADFAADVLRAIAGPDITEAALAEQVAAMARIPAEALARSVACLVHHDTRAELHRISAPTQVLVGEFDAETPVEYARALAEGIPGAVLRVVSGAGHLLNAEAPAKFDELVAAFVREHPGGRISS